MDMNKIKKPTVLTVIKMSLENTSATEFDFLIQPLNEGQELNYVEHKTCSIVDAILHARKMIAGLK